VPQKKLQRKGKKKKGKENFDIREYLMETNLLLEKQARKKVEEK
jgi:hypothetical protein